MIPVDRAGAFVRFAERGAMARQPDVRVQDAEVAVSEVRLRLAGRVRVRERRRDRNDREQRTENEVERPLHLSG